MPMLRLMLLRHAKSSWTDPGREDRDESLRHKGNGSKSVLLIGHNPSLERLTLRLAGRGDQSLKERIAKKYPTGALAVLEFRASDWKDVKDAGGRIVSFTRPKDVMAKE